MTTEQLESRIIALLPDAGYCLAPQVIKKSHLPRRVIIELHVWLQHRTLIYTAATNAELWQRLQDDLRQAPSRTEVGEFKIA